MKQKRKREEPHGGAYTLKGIDPALWRLVKSRAALAGQTISEWILDTIRTAAEKGERMKIGALILAVVVLAGGCATSHQTPEERAKVDAWLAEVAERAKTVVVTINPDMVKGCKNLGIEHQLQVDSQGFRPEDQKDPEYILRHATASRNGNFALYAPGQWETLYTDSTRNTSYGRRRVLGESYLCERGGTEVAK